MSEKAFKYMQKKVPGLIGFKPEKSKVSRASGIVPLVEAGNGAMAALSTRAVSARNCGDFMFGCAPWHD